MVGCGLLFGPTFAGYWPLVVGSLLALVLGAAAGGGRAAGRKIVDRVASASFSLFSNHRHSQTTQGSTGRPSNTNWNDD